MKRVKIIITTLFFLLVLSLILNAFLLIKIHKINNNQNPIINPDNSENTETTVPGYVGKWNNGNLYLVINEDNTAYWIEKTSITSYVSKGKLVGDIVIMDKQLNRALYPGDASHIDMDNVSRISEDCFEPSPKTFTFNLNLYEKDVLYVDTTVYLRQQ